MASSVRTKAYTISLLINEVSSLSASKIDSFNTLATYLSPRAGAKSAKVQVLNSFLGGKLRTVASSNQYGSNVKARVLKALKARKNNGSF